MWVCRMQRACGSPRWRREWMKKAVGSGGSPPPATDPSGSTNSRSDARISEKWRPCGLTRKRSPLGLIATLKWLQTPSWKPSRAAQRKAAAKSIRCCLISSVSMALPLLIWRPRDYLPAWVRSNLAGSSKEKRLGGNSAIRLIRIADGVTPKYPYQGSRHERSGFPRRSCPDHRRSGPEHRDAVGHVEEAWLPPTLFGQ